LKKNRQHNGFPRKMEECVHITLIQPLLLAYVKRGSNPAPKERSNPKVKLAFLLWPNLVYKFQMIGL
jgi:hypothetical protein